MGCPVLLVDEDTSATNLMIRDERMRALVADEKEPITPFVDRIGGLARAGVSTILVMGGSVDYLDVADLVLMMDSYVAHDVTQKAREVVEAQPRERMDVEDFPAVKQRVMLPLKAHGGKAKTKSKGLDSISLDRQDIDVSNVEQIVDGGQTEAIAWAIRALTDGERATAFDGETTLAQALEALDAIIEQHGLDGLGGPEKSAFMVRPRMVDLAAALNRYRSIRIA